MKPGGPRCNFSDITDINPARIMDSPSNIIEMYLVTSHSCVIRTFITDESFPPSPYYSSMKKRSGVYRISNSRSDLTCVDVSP